MPTECTFLVTVPGEDGLGVAVLEVVQLDEAGGRPLSGRGGEGHVAAEVAAVRVERHQPLRWGKLADIK